ncbi:ATP-binding cassette domain-containing protein, partial [Candidatus Bathyarchaeota archaeon]|nr:ATP-binding cassette domain-containing protein [Candidatus Bathyarchaeota archaeon]
NISCSGWKTADSRSTTTVSITNSSNISIVDSNFPNDTITHEFINCTDINLENLTFMNWSVSAFLLNECHDITFSNNILNESGDSPGTAFIMINCDGTLVKNSRCMDYDGMCFGIQGNDLNASKNTTFANITFDNCSKAIDAGNSGDIWVENVSVNNSQFAINFHSCSNVHISNSSMDSSFSHSISMSYCNNTHISDGFFRNNTGFSGSIYMYEAKGFELNNCSFLPNPQKRHHGVLLLYSSGGNMNGNRFNHSYDRSIGIYIQHSTEINVEENTFNNYSIGINVYESTKVNVTSNNFISMQETGVLLEHSSNVIISLNELQGNEGISGVRLTSSWFNSLQSNLIDNFSYGIYLWDAISNDFQDMTIQACSYGIYIYNSRQNVIIASNFTNFNEYGILIEQSRDNNITWCSFSQSSNCIHEDKESKDNHFSNNTNCDYSGIPSPRKNPFVVVGISGILTGALLVGLIIYQKITIKKKKELARKYKDVPSNRKVILKLDRIRKEYTMGKETIHALKDASLEVERGDFIAIMGPSGSGKSTLLNIIGTLDAPTSGMLFLNGKSIFTNEMVAREKKGGNYKTGKSLKLAKEVELAKLRRMHIGFVFQFYNLIPVLSALENVMLPMTIQPISRDEKREKALNLLELVGLKGMGDRLPSQLSGGEQQRVSIARALANDPIIVLADEPTGNLDQGTGREIMKLFEKLNSENAQTFLIVTHDPAVASRAHKIIHIRDGSIDH